jgi:TolB protein
MLLPVMLAIAGQGPIHDNVKAPNSVLVAPVSGEANLANVRQLTFGGQNAEAYWSADGKKISYQASLPGMPYPDEQIFSMNADGSDKRLVSTGKGRTTCAFFSPDGKYVYFSSTHARNEGAQASPDMSKGYVWVINPDYELYRVGANTKEGGKVDGVPATGPSALTRISNAPGTYVAEATIAPNGQYMVWTTDKDGDLEIYRSDLEGKNATRLTSEVGYDGGPFVSWDSKKIVYRRDEFADAKAVESYKYLLKDHMIRPSKLEIWIMDADGSNKRQVTKLGCASFAPFLHPDGKRIIFSSNYGDPKGREFDIFMINVDGTGLRRITNSPEFDGFPMFSKDGKKLVFASNRYGKQQGETNVFVADWKE